MNAKLLGATAALIALAAAAGANAQTHKARAASTSAAAPSPSVSPLTYGPAIPGLCIYSNSRVIESSNVGKAFAARMQQLRSQAAAELSGEQTALQNEEKALTGKRATLTQEQFAQQAQPLAAREQALNQKADLRSRELQATYMHQLQRLGQQVEPLVQSAFESHHCTVLLNGDTVMANNPQMDLSPEVTTALNAKMSTITFDRETAPAQ